MIKDIMEANDCMSPNDKELAILKENFPSCFRTDGSFDMVRFSEYLKDKIDITHEGYELKFLGKSYAKMLASLDTETVIVPDDNHNSLPENKNSENIYISGDNLDGLKHLLKSYAGEVKCIYIDPPYNTGSDGFVYNDKFNFTVSDLVTKLSIDEEQAQRILDLTKRGSASHSAWLMFMYPRLQLARDLLKDDGVIFISIDENESSNLKLICDEIFGEDNFYGDIIWEATTQPTNAGKARFGYQQKTEPILFYAKDKSKIEEFVLDEIDAGLAYPHVGKFGKCRFEVIEKSDAGGYSRPTMKFTILGQYPRDGKRWQIGEAAARKLEEEGKVELVDGIVKKAVYPEDEIERRQFRPFWSLMLADEYGSALNGKDELNTLMGEPLGFDTVKPTKLIKRLLSYLGDDYYVLDFFSGSATTADATLQLNAEDNGNRKYIMIQISDDIAEESDLYRAGYSNISELGIERIIRAAKKIKEENPDTAADLGFKHYTLQDVSDSTLDRMESFDDSGFIIDTSIYDQFGANTILTTWLVRDGYGLNSDVEMVNLGDYIAYWSHNHLYFINPGLTEDAIKTLIDKYNSQGNFNPQNIILFGYNFTYVEMENIKTNVKILRDSEKNLKINLDIRY